MSDEAREIRPFIPDKTEAAIHKIVADITKICGVISVVVNLSLIAYYIYSVIANREKIPLLIINIGILTLVTATFVFGIVAYKKGKKFKKIKRKTYRLFRIMLDLLHIAAATVALYEAIEFGVSTIKIFITAFMCIGVFVRILAEVVRYLIGNYLTLLYQGLKMDIEEFAESRSGKAIIKTVDTFGNFKAAAVELIDKPVSAVAKMLNKEETLSPEEQNEPERVLSEKEKNQRELLYAISEEQKEKKKKQKDDRLERSIEKLKSHFKSIFKK